MTNAEKRSIEAMIDRNGLSDVLEALQDICYSKGAHIVENWQDTTMASASARANRWERIGAKLDVLRYDAIIENL